MFLGWYDPDKKKPARAKLAEASERYQEKFGRPPAACLTSNADAEDLGNDPKAPALPVRGVAFIPRHTFYVGVDELPAAMAEAA